MDRSSPESEKLRRGLRESFRFFWYRTASALRSMFSSKPEYLDAPAPVCNRRDCSDSRPGESENDYDVADALSVSGAFSRHWEEISEQPVENTDESSTFRVASYNVLCQRSLEQMPELYSHIESSSPFKLWSHRWELFVNEICALDADIIALQEVPEIAFRDCFEPLLASLGYSILYCEKTLERHNHGLVLAVRNQTFEIESHEFVDFYFKEDAVLDRRNIGQIVRLICKKTGSSILLAHTHLLFDPYRGDTKFAQIAYLISLIHQSRIDDEPIITLGDFNLEPSSKLFDFITTGSLNATKFSIQRGSGQVSEDSVLVPDEQFLYELPRMTLIHTMMDRTGAIQSTLFDLLYSLITTLPNQFDHRLHFKSTYAPNESSVSTFHSTIGNPDHIFYDAGNISSSFLTLNRRLALPTVDHLSGTEKWPNEKIPSDHICLLAEFTLTRLFL